MQKTVKPILFSGPMVRAIKEGFKTETRRVMRPQPALEKMWFDGMRWKWKMYLGPTVGHDLPVSPYGVIGGTLWVREKFTIYYDDLDLDKNGYVVYAADTWYEDSLKGSWKPSIHMPRKYARLFLKIEDMWIEPLQDISEESVHNEGLDNLSDFKHLWDEINGKRGYSWDKNPWVWVIKFKVK